jgi:hypothetical protein
MHNNPLHEKWKLCTSPTDYMFSPAKFYETGIDEIFILSNCTIERFGLVGDNTNKERKKSYSKT